MKSTKSTVERVDIEELLKILGEEAPVGICIMQDGKFCYFNSNFPVATGYTAGELVGKDSLEIVAPEDREMVRESTIKMLKGKLLSPYQFRVIHKGGGIIWIMATVKSIQYHGRRATLGSYMEVTERKQIEEALKESGEKYRELANSITDVFFATDEHLRYTYWNKASEILTGIRAEDALGKSLQEVFPDTDWVRRAEKVYRKVLQTQQPQTFINEADIGGRHYIFESSAYPSQDGISVFVKDITEHKQAEEKLKESEQKYRTILEEMGDGYFETDLAGNFTFVNDAMIRTLGYSKEEIIGMNYRALRPKEQAKAVFKAYNHVYKTGEPLRDILTEIICKDGGHLFAETSAFPIRNDKGEIIGFRGVRRDITERRQAAETLRQSEEKYRTILEEMEDAYFEVDLGGHFTFVNSATCRQLGYSEEELIGMSYKGFTAEEDIESVFRIFNKVYRTDKPNKSCSWTIVRKDGTHRLIEHSALPIRNDKGEIIGFRGVGRDITERKQAEEKLRQSEENYRALFDNTVIGTIVLDAETMKVVMVNQAAVSMLGFSSVEEAIGIDPFAFVFPEDREGYLELAKKAFFEGNLRGAYEVRAVTKDGREKWMNAKATMITHRGKLACLISFADITEQKQQTEQLMMTDRLASLGELASGTAHELNNPLTSIVGFSQLLLEKEVPDDIREDLKIINKEAQRAASVTKNLITFARKHTPAKQPNQINSIIEDLLELRAYEQKVNNIEVERHLAADLPKIMVDYFQIQQVFMNIIINAEYFMTEAHNRGTLTVTTKKQNDTVVISIADDGPGILPENLKRIFDPFFTTKAAGKGTGLGLSICHGIVTEHGGQIYAKSKLGKGTTIFVELPISDSRPY
jgi:two-component system NtrC family sensor kinase